MQAGLYHRLGPAKDVLVIEELEKPEPAKGQVRVRMMSSGVNPSDVKTRAGKGRPMTASWQIPHSDGAGVIDAVGDGVATSRIGEKVWIFNAAFMRPLGTSAEWTVVPSETAPRLPDGLGFDEGACLGIPVMTAHRSIYVGGVPKQGETILVTGGAGVVGHYAIQLAKWAGATVLTTVSSDQKAAHAKQAGADYVINYKNQDVIKEVKSIVGEEGVDRIIDFDFGKNFPISLEIIKSGGCISSYASMGSPTPTYPFYAAMFKNLSVHHVFVYTMSNIAKQQAINDIERWAKTGNPKFAIANKFKFTEIIKAHEAVELGSKIGHVILSQQ